MKRRVASGWVRWGPWQGLCRKRRVAAGLVRVCLACLAGVSGAAVGSDIDGMEHLFGATNVNAMTGNGGLSVGIARTGEVTVFRWPSPSYYDQVHYLTSNAPDAREQPYFGAKPNEGVFAGLVYTIRGGEVRLSWFRDFPQVSQTYLHDGSAAVVTTAREPTLGVTATATSFVKPDQDVLVTRYRVALDAGSPIVDAALIAYENLSPCLDKYPLAPITDWFLDVRNDFGVMVDSSRGALVHFLPQSGDLSLLDPYMSTVESDAELSTRIAEEIDGFLASLGPGIFVAMGADRAIDGYQAGADGQHRCLTRPEWSRHPRDAFEDPLDGDLSGSPVAGCQANGALRVPLTLTPGGDDAVTVYMVVAGEAPPGDNPLDRLERARRTPFEDHLRETDEYWAATLAQANLPATSDPDELAFARRTLISVLQGTDRTTGAIVASIATQPPYGEDWPRDSAFFNYALDIAGFHEMVTQHNRFLASVQNLERGRITPQGAWFMNYYADGMPGGPVPFEIDEVGLSVWTLWTHAKFLQDLQERTAYLEEVYDAIEAAGRLMLECRDEETGLQCRANEDDNPRFTQGLQGAETVYLGLRSAAAATRALCLDERIAARYDARADELQAALVDAFYDESSGTFQGGSVAWTIWPAKVLPYDDPRMQNTASTLYAWTVPPLYQQNDGGSYHGKNTLALARIWINDPARLEDAADLIHILAAEVPTPGTRHVGEVFMNLDTDGDGALEYDNRTAVPHLWTATLTYLSLMARYNPELFDAVEDDTPFTTTCP